MFFSLFGESFGLLLVGGKSGLAQGVEHRALPIPVGVDHRLMEQPAEILHLLTIEAGLLGVQIIPQLIGQAGHLPFVPLLEIVPGLVFF